MVDKEPHQQGYWHHARRHQAEEPNAGPVAGGACGMGAFGDAHPRATVTENQVRQIIQLLQSRKTQKEVARQFGVNRLVVEGIASGRHWQHVPRPANFDTTIRHRAKLTEDQVREIRHLLKAGHSQGGIAKRFDVVRTTIRDITTGRTWGWLAD
jgi:hypothetical protein